MSKAVIRYSEAFKVKVVNELETGKLSTVSGAMELYGIRGSETVKKWLQNYGKNHLLNKVVTVQTADEKSEIKKYKTDIRKLKEALADAHLDLRIEQEYFKMACEVGNIEYPAKFKKKLNLH